MQKISSIKSKNNSPLDGLDWNTDTKMLVIQFKPGEVTNTQWSWFNQQVALAFKKIHSSNEITILHSDKGNKLLVNP
jgi:hypothetical protein